MVSNEYGYRWVRGLDDSAVAHYAAPGCHLGRATVCRKSKIGLDWDGAIDPVLPELGEYPVAEARCGACVVQYLVDTKQINVKTPHRS
jgi:hypothetical protein